MGLAGLTDLMDLTGVMERSVTGPRLSPRASGVPGGAGERREVVVGCESAVPGRGDPGAALLRPGCFVASSAGVLPGEGRKRARTSPACRARQTVGRRWQ
ncbi:hypothetical protein GCM10009564_48980 [Streptomyces thermogriseus]|uniref:Uncharacterized protein n=1 Tax=Streptomyces thermogriseus TaxID=75292 RepID=A0ABP4DRU9_9ACTN